MYAAVDLSTLPRGGRPDLPSTDETTALQVIKMMLDRGANPNIQLKLRPPFRNVIFDRGSDNAVLTIRSDAVVASVESWRQSGSDQAPS